MVTRFPEFVKERDMEVSVAGARDKLLAALERYES
jgi:hypothetical protein